MSTQPTSKPDRQTMWQRTLQSFLGDRVRIKLRGGTYLEGELQDPQPNSVTLLQPSGSTRLVEYTQIAEVEAAK